MTIREKALVGRPDGCNYLFMRHRKFSQQDPQLIGNVHCKYPVIINYLHGKIPFDIANFEGNIEFTVMLFSNTDQFYVVSGCHLIITSPPQ